MAGQQGANALRQEGRGQSTEFKLELELESQSQMQLQNRTNARNSFGTVLFSLILAASLGTLLLQAPAPAQEQDVEQETASEARAAEASSAPKATAEDRAESTANLVFSKTFAAGDGSFTISMPESWQYTVDEKNGRFDAVGKRGGRFSILTFCLPASYDPSTWPQITSAILKAQVPQVKWSAPSVTAEGQVFSQSENKDVCTAVAFTEFLNLGKATLGRLKIAVGANHGVVDEEAVPVAATLKILPLSAARAIAPPSGAEAAERAATHQTDQSPQSIQSTEADQTSQSFQPSAADQTSQYQPTASEQLPQSFQTFVDPDQQAFTVEVPAGWKVEGGLVRPRAIDARPWVKTYSPDGRIMAFIGDAKFPPYTMPNAQLTMLGFPEGSNYQGSMVKSYIPARRFAEMYARANLKGVDDLRVVEEHGHPDLAREINGTVGASKSEAASIKLTGSYQGKPGVAYYLACTKATIGYGTGMWWITLLAGEMSPAEYDQEGLAAITHMLSTFKYDPQWKANSVATAGEVSRQYTAASQAASRAITQNYWSQQAANERIHSAYWNRQAANDRSNAAYWDRQASQDASADNFSNYIRGVENVTDTATGSTYQVEYGPRYHWVDPSGSYYTGTDHSAPAPDWRQLMPTR
ncbi:MAG TPA: hypothetical protein PKE54_15640 [Candidatus Obscuribacter sp.]|nr:hypothetical protein [Candidatus Obscuribacter sp.]HND04322.1 hypothetical protein [Candidatus Obscuribacter sp.]